MKKIIAFILTVLSVVGVYETINRKSVKNDSKEKPAVSFVVEANDLFGFDFNQLHDEIFDVVSKCGYIRAVCADGRPFVYVDIDVPSPTKKYTKTKQRKINEKNTAEIITLLNDVAPKTAENDLLGAVKLGKQELGRCRDATSCNMIVISSGISRAGVLCFQNFSYEYNGRKVNSLLMAEPEDIAAKLSENHSIPDLSKIDAFSWFGCGVPFDKQNIPDSAAINIQELWAAITDEAGCQADFNDIALADKPFVTDLQSTVIDFGEDTIIITPPDIDLKFNESHLGFIANEAVLCDEKNAADLLRPYARSIIEYSNTAKPSGPVLFVVGMTATFGDPERCEQLSLARAEKVKQILVSQGCPEEYIGTLGLGQGGPDSMRVDDTIQTDDLDALEALRKENRVVYLIGIDSEKANLLGIS